MSIKCLNQAFDVEGLSPTKKLILVLLGNYADEKNTCYPSHRHIADKVGLKDTKGVQRTIKEFEDLGYLKIERRKNEEGANTSNRYHLTIGEGSVTPRGVETPNPTVTQPPNTKDNTKDIYSEKFEIFWRIYPRKIAKKSAYKSWSKFDEKHYDKILYGAQRFAEQSQKTEEKYIPHATTWLNQERWLDFFETDKYGCVIKAKPQKKINNLAG
jgi:DNA-binding transcriptional MocR family regulator